MNQPRLVHAVRFAFAIACLFLITPAITAQHIRGALEGRVVDPAGAVVSGAKVKARNVANNAEVLTTTNDSGVFRLQNLEPGEYDVTVEGSGFRTFLAKRVTIKVGSVTPMDVHIEIGETSAVIE